MLTGLFLAMIRGDLGSALLAALSHRWENCYKDSTWGWWLLAQNLQLKLQTLLGISVTTRKSKREETP